jgi:hypothetical protein
MCFVYLSCAATAGVYNGSFGRPPAVELVTAAADDARNAAGTAAAGAGAGAAGGPVLAIAPGNFLKHINFLASSRDMNALWLHLCLAGILALQLCNMCGAALASARIF